MNFEVRQNDEKGLVLYHSSYEFPCILLLLVVFIPLVGLMILDGHAFQGWRGVLAEIILIGLGTALIVLTYLQPYEERMVVNRLAHTVDIMRRRLLWQSTIHLDFQQIRALESGATCLALDTTEAIVKYPLAAEFTGCPSQQAQQEAEDFAAGMRSILGVKRDRPKAVAC